MPPATAAATELVERSPAGSEPERDPQSVDLRLRLVLQQAARAEAALREQEAEYFRRRQRERAAAIERARAERRKRREAEAATEAVPTAAPEETPQQDFHAASPEPSEAEHESQHQQVAEFSENDGRSALLRCGQSARPLQARAFSG
uniref:Uncharacterized protein n=1 Tax=Pyrodinium bahamense TaxID=73915 RepID=A0A7S0FRM5_9DINO